MGVFQSPHTSMSKRKQEPSSLDGAQTAPRRPSAGRHALRAPVSFSALFPRACCTVDGSLCPSTRKSLSEGLGPGWGMEGVPRLGLRFEPLRFVSGWSEWLAGHPEQTEQPLMWGHGCSRGSGLPPVLPARPGPAGGSRAARSLKFGQ